MYKKGNISERLFRNTSFSSLLMIHSNAPTHEEISFFYGGRPLGIDGLWRHPENNCRSRKFDYTVEQFADLQILRYRVPGFEELSLKQKN